jgi:hypothetical protein
MGHPPALMDRGHSAEDMEKLLGGKTDARLRDGARLG